MLKPFRPLESATGGCQKHPKMANFEPKKTVFGRFWGSLVTFFGALMAQTGPPGCVWQCSTMFNHVQPMFNPFALAGTAYGQIWPFWAKKGCFWALLGPPGDISGWSKRLKLTPPDVKYNVQPCSTNVQPIWACWDRLWPIMAFLGKKWQFLAIKMAKTTEIWWAQGWTSISPTQETIWMHWFLQNQTFFWPPPP